MVAFLLLLCFGLFSDTVSAADAAQFRMSMKGNVSDDDDDNNNNNNIYLLQFGCHPVAVVILHVNKHEIGYY